MSSMEIWLMLQMNGSFTSLEFLSLVRPPIPLHLHLHLLFKYFPIRSALRNSPFIPLPLRLKLIHPTPSALFHASPLSFFLGFIVLCCCLMLFSHSLVVVFFFPFLLWPVYF